MDPITKFRYVELLGTLLVPVIVAASLASPRPRSFIAKCGIAIGLSWLCTVLYTLFLYNPAGIAAGHALGQDFPEIRYDNNTSGIAIFFGWLCPTVLVVVIAGVRYLWLRSRKSAA